MFSYLHRYDLISKYVLYSLLFYEFNTLIRFFNFTIFPFDHMITFFCNFNDNGMQSAVHSVTF